MKCKRRILINKMLPPINFNKSSVVENDIRSMFLMKNGSAKAEITFEKDAYFPGETAVVFVNVDNSKCEKNIERVKVMFKRSVIA